MADYNSDRTGSNIDLTLDKVDALDAKVQPTGTGVDVTGTVTADGLTVDGTDPIFANRMSSDGTIILLAKDNSAVGSIGVLSNDNLALLGSVGGHAGLIFGSNQFLPASSSDYADATVDLGNAGTRFKDLYLSGGVYLGGTGAANKLDDYEEGAWIPSLIQTTTSPSLTYTARIGRYVKIGSMVFVRLNVEFNSLSGGSGGIAIGNLPFTSSHTYSSAFSSFGSMCVAATGIFGTNSVTAFARGDILGGAVASLADITATSSVSFNSSGRIDMGFCYQTSQ